MKIVRQKGKPWELYDLANDPVEKTNLSKQMPDKVAELLELYEGEKAKDK